MTTCYTLHSRYVEQGCWTTPYLGQGQVRESIHGQAGLLPVEPRQLAFEYPGSGHRGYAHSCEEEMQALAQVLPGGLDSHAPVCQSEITNHLPAPAL